MRPDGRPGAYRAALKHEEQNGETKSKSMANVETIAADAASSIVERLTGRPADKVAVAAAVSQAKA